MEQQLLQELHVFFPSHMLYIRVTSRGKFMSGIVCSAVRTSCVWSCWFALFVYIIDDYDYDKCSYCSQPFDIQLTLAVSL